ncbi:MAG: M20/M25/M40 family metallo-hydrolase [bacterium]
MKRQLSLFAGILLLPIILSCQTSAQNKFDSNQLVQSIRFLASDSLQGRRTGSVGNKIAGAFIEQAFQKIKLQPFGDSFRHDFTFKSRRDSTKSFEGVNFVGYLKGKTQSDSFIVVTAHYDHLGVRDSLIYNGADDNASGVGAVLAAAEYFNRRQPMHSIIFVAFDAEEIGLQGARAFVANPPVKRENIVLNINLDMVSRNDKKELYACGATQYPQLKPYVERAAAKNTEINLLFGHDTNDGKPGDNWTFASDHGPFHSAKIPFIYFGVEDHPDYHKPSDDFEKIEIAFYVDVVNFIIDAIGEFDRGM